MRTIKNILCIAILFMQSVLCYGQYVTLDEIEKEAANAPAFNTLKVGNLQSTKVAAPGELYAQLSHRFGSLKNNGTDFFSNNTTRVYLAYGLIKWVQIGISYETLRKTLAGSGKIGLMEQNEAFPFNITAYGTINLNNELSQDRYPNMKYADRLSYTSQLLISRRFSKIFSFELAPTFVRQNLVLEPFQQHNQIAIAAATRFRLSQSMALNIEYVYNFNRADESVYFNPVTIGLDFKKDKTTFQLLFTNAQSTNEPGFISNAEGDWNDAIFFTGFNVSSVF